MSVTKWDLKEFKSLQQQDLVAASPINSTQAAEQDNAAAPLVLVDFAGDVTDNETKKSVAQAEAKKLEVELAKLEVEKSMLEQNTLTQNTLSEIKELLADIERQQDTRLKELSKNILLFIKNLTSRLFANPLFGKTVTDVAVTHINDIIGKVKNSSSLNIKIPKDMSEAVKSSLLTTFKSTASKLNIEVIEHEEENQKIAVEWEDGRAELQLDNPIKVIEEELHKFDNKS